MLAILTYQSLIINFQSSGLQKWEEGRKDWLAKAAAANPAFQKDKVQAVDLDVDEV